MSLRITISRETRPYSDFYFVYLFFIRKREKRNKNYIMHNASITCTRKTLCGEEK